MHVTRLAVAGLRRFAQVELTPMPGLNLITGDNGAGKTSLLEALHLMAWGRSFRGRVRDGLIRTGSEAVEVFVEWQEGQEWRTRRAGLRHSGHEWVGRLDGENIAQLGDLCAALAVVSFEPGSHALVTGGGEPRRRFLDWGLFHVEQEFLGTWRRYNRALKQRNALLKSGGAAAQLDAWDMELADAGEMVTMHRQIYLDRLQHQLSEVSEALVPMLGRAQLEFSPGWRRQDLSLADALVVSRDRDRQFGHTGVGPHRADWRVEFSTLPNRETLSRGQAKLTALSCLLAQAQDYAIQRGEWPVVALDDLASELDRRHQASVLARVMLTGAQVFLTGTEVPAALESSPAQAWFHVEQDKIVRR